MRRIAFSNKKVRGVTRRLKALSRWANSFENYFPDDLAQSLRYRNFKIPVLATLVEGKQATDAIRSQCAQQLINACQHLIDARPSDAPDCLVVASIALPDMFSSEVCIYTDRDYHRAHMQPSHDQHCHSQAITDQNLAEQWGLMIPEGMQCIGLSLECKALDGMESEFRGQRWYFGEITHSAPTQPQ